LSPPARQVGAFTLTKGETGVDEGIKTGPDASFFGITSPLSAPLVNDGKDLVVSYTVKHEQHVDCGGSYIKLLPGGFEAKKFSGETPYALMFGPDVCGTSTRKTHVIFTYKGKNLLTKKNVKVETDRLPHRYTLIVRPDNTYEVQIDGTKAESGSLLDDFDFLLPKMIKDPAQSKPADWVDAAMIDDPADVKPAGYDDIPAKIPDASAKQPEDWDVEEDGEWEAPKVDNPEYKGPWVAKKIANPEYKGAWVHPEIANPDYVADDKVHAVCSTAAPCTAVGFELWQVKAGTVFDDIYVGDSVEEAEAFATATFGAKKDAEKKNLDDIEEKAKAEAEEARKKAEAESKAAEAAKKDEPAAAADDEEDL
jgi:calreticulin